MPLTPITKPAALGAGGGEPGAALQALIRAIKARDWKVARIHLPEDEVPKQMPSDHIFLSLAANYPREATVTGGRVKGDHAHLEFTGLSEDGRKTRGDFAMRKVGAVWRVHGHVTYSVE